MNMKTLSISIHLMIPLAGSKESPLSSSGSQLYSILEMLSIFLKIYLDFSTVNLQKNKLNYDLIKLFPILDYLFAYTTPLLANVRVNICFKFTPSPSSFHVVVVLDFFAEALEIELFIQLKVSSHNKKVFDGLHWNALSIFIKHPKLSGTLAN